MPQAVIAHDQKKSQRDARRRRAEVRKPHQAQLTWRFDSLAAVEQASGMTARSVAQRCAAARATPSRDLKLVADYQADARIAAA